MTIYRPNVDETLNTVTKRKHVSTMQVAAIATFAQSNILSFFSIFDTFKI